MRVCDPALCMCTDCIQIYRSPLKFIFQAKFTEMEIYSAAIEHERARLESEAKSKQEAMQSLQEAKLQLEVCMCAVCYVQWGRS